jgi:predicted Rossmann fold nucleotide-binding protein DprA/Smf involved in DNA uptake
MSWFFGGSREMPAAAQEVADNLVFNLLSGSRSAVVCDCTGADEMFVRSFVRFGGAARLRLVRVGFGFSPSRGLPAAARAAGAAVSSGPFVGFRAGALAARARLACSGVSGGSLLFSSPESRGSLLCADYLEKQNVPVYAYCVGFAGSPAGSWLPFGSWFGASVWVRFPRQLPLL